MVEDGKDGWMGDKVLEKNEGAVLYVPKEDSLKFLDPSSAFYELPFSDQRGLDDFPSCSTAFYSSSCTAFRVISTDNT